MALHQAGKLHRDIKPPNVLVTLEDRVVLLDFGLTADLEASGSDRQVVGTIGTCRRNRRRRNRQHGQRLVQRRRDVVRSDDRPAAVCRHAGRGAGRQAEPAGALAGYPGRRAAARPGSAVRALLDRDVDQTAGRAGSDRAADAAFRAGRASPEPARAFPLIGRSRHRQVLDGLLATLHRRKTVSLFVFGRTGTGKTTLVRSFLDELLEREEAVVLSGRCYERESVPYKASTA